MLLAHDRNGAPIKNGTHVSMPGESGTGIATKATAPGRVYVDWGGWGMEFTATNLEVVDCRDTNIF